MNSADLAIFGSGSVEMLIAFCAFLATPFEKNEAASDTGDGTEGQVDSKHLMHDNCAEEARRNGKVAHPSDVYPVAWRTHIAAITVDVPAGGRLLSTARRIGFGKLHGFEAINELAGEALVGHASLSNLNFKSNQATPGLTS